MFPSIFLSHGSPLLLIKHSPAHDFLSGLGRQLGRPKAVVIASAHWDTSVPAINAVEENGTIHDFYGFPRALYEFRYPAPGSADVSERVSDLLVAAGIRNSIDPRRGLDHGAWMPLTLMYPDHDIPVVTISVQSNLGTAHHLQLGKALAALRAEDVLVIGSGSFTHDLRRFRGGRSQMDDPEPADVAEFSAWMNKALEEGRTCDLLTYRRQAPYAAENHPTEEHLMPLYVALGAAGDSPTVSRLHTSTEYGFLRMDAFAFH